MLIRHNCTTLITCLFISVFFLFSNSPADAHMVTATIPANQTDYVGYNATTNRIYAVSAISDTVQVIDGATNTISATITLTKAGPSGAFINPHNNKIYTLHFAVGGVTAIDGATNALNYIATGTNASGVAVNPVTDKVYVANSGSNTVSVINGTDTLVSNIPVGSNPTSVAVNTTTNRIYVTNASSNSVSVIDGNSDTVLTTITVGTFPYRVAVNENTDRIYVANNTSNDVSVIDGTNNIVAATVAAGTNPGFISVNPAGNKIYVNNTNSPNITVINGADNTAVNLPVSGKPVGINQTTNTIYVANGITNPPSLPIISGATNTITMVFPPFGTNDIAVNQSANLAYLANSSGISILDSNQYNLTTSSYSPDFGSGTVTATPASTGYPAGTVVTLKATPALGSYFSGWSGACTGNYSLTCKVTMDGAKTATANFTTTPPTITTWSKSIGNPAADDSFKAVQQTADGGYVMAGNYGYNGGVSQDFWVVKMNADGTVAWQKSYNGRYDSFSLNGNESANAIQQTADGGYILAGTTLINGGSRGWLLRLDSLGNHLWNRPIGSDDASYSSFNSVQQTSDGGFIATGSANNNIWLVKTTATGVIEWQKGVLSGGGSSVVQTSDDGYIVAGGTLLTKFTANGSAVWQSQLNGVTITSVVQNLDGSYAAGGYSAVASAGGNDVWVAKIDATGANIIWQKSLGGSGNDYGTSLQQTTDGGYIIGGYSDTLGAGLQDILLIKLDATGALQGSHTYGGSSFDSGAAVQQTADGGFILVGQTYVGTAMYKNDGWAMKLDATGMMTGCEASAILTPALTVVDPGITIVQSAVSSSNVTNKFAATFSSAPIDTSVAAVSGAVCYITSYPVDGKLTVVPGNAQVELFWTPATSANGITSYKVAKGINGFSMLTDCSTGVDVGNVTSYLDNTPPLINEQKYYYRVCAVDAFTAVSAGLTASATPSATLNSLTITKSGAGSGKISSIAGNLDCGGICTNNYLTGSVVTLIATPASGSYFNGWSGACAGNASLTCKVTMTAAVNVTADFTTTPPASVPTWSKVLHSSGFDVAWAVRETADGGAVIAGEKNSAAWVIKLAAGGSIQWQNTYGNAGYYRINEIQQTADGGYITAGTGNSASWIMKLAADGSLTWENNYIGVYPGEAYSVQQASDGGYIFAGYLSPGISNIDALVVKLDAAGNVSWDKTYGNSSRGEYAYSIRQTADGGYIVGGKIETALITYDAWAMKLFTDGSIDWQKHFNINSYYSQIKAIEPASDGGFIAVGQNNFDAWIVKLNGLGSLQWQNSYNHFGNQGAASVVEATDGSYVFATKGALANISSDGTTLLWQRDYAYVNGDELHSVQATADGGYLAVGASGGSIDSDIWLLKTGTNGFISGWMRSITSTFSTTAALPTDTTFSFAPAFISKSISTSAVIPHYMLTINKSGTGYGIIYSSETPRPEIDCGNICTTVYPANAAVSLNATSFAAATFTGWSDAGCSGTGVCTFNISADTTVSAPFSANSTAVILDETFNSTTFPAGWTTAATSGSAWSSFASANSPLALNSARGGGGYVAADALSDSVLISPQIDMSLYSTTALVFKTAGGGGNAYVEYSTDNGITWTSAFNWNGSFTSGSTTQIVDLSAMAGSSTARFQLHFIGGDSNSWVVDDVQLYGVMLPNLPIISINPNAYNFGTVPVSGNASWPLTISNKGTAPLNISGISITGPEYSVDSTVGTTPCNSLAPVIAAGSSCTVTVKVTPLTTGLKNAVVTIASDAANMANVTASFSAKTTPQTVAYIYDTNTLLRDEFNTYLTGLGYSVSTVQMIAAETYDFSTTDLILIGHDTSGFFTATNGNNWGTATAITNVSGSNKPILGLGFGGASLFSNLGLFINWGNGWTGADKDINVVNPAHPFFTTPKAVSGAPVSLYSVPTDEIGIFMPTPQTGVTPLGLEFTDTTYYAHYSLIQQTTANQTYTLWGFGGSPSTMTTDGQNLFSNILQFYAPTPAVVTQNYSITASAAPSVGGSITPAGLNSVTSGGSLAFAITPFSGYHIADVTVDGVSQGAITAYTFNNVTANHTIDATFAVNTTPTAFTIDGSVNYSGSKSGRIYVTVFTPNGPMGTSMTAPGNFSIQGIPAGSYQVTAFMDVLGTGSRHESDPAGVSALVTVATANISGVSVNMTDPAPLTTVQPPSGLRVFPADSAALAQWNQLDTGNGSQADSYSLYWDAGPNPVPGSTTGSRLDIPASGDKNDLLLGGLANGTYYFVMTAKSGTVTSAPSAVYGPVTIGTPAGGYTVSGTVTFPAVANGKPLYLAIGDKNNILYPAYIAAATSPQAYTVSGVPNGSYRVFGIIDVNNDGLIGIGDYKSNDLSAPFITVNNGALVNADLTIGSENAGVRVMTQHWKASTLDMFNLNFELYDGLKRPATVRLNGGPNVTGPIDIGLNKWGGFYSMVNINTATPVVNDTYTLAIGYTDGSSETISGQVTGVVNDFATPTTPAGSISFNATPTLSWTAPASQPANGSYTLQLHETGAAANPLFWDSNPLPLTQTSAVYNFDGNASQATLTNGKSYNWGIMVNDQLGNFSTSYANFNFPGEVTLTPSLYDFGTVPVGGGAAWPLTLSNNGSSPVSVYGMTVSGADFTLDYTGGANPCNSPYPFIAAGGNCTFNILINPTTAGLKSATVTVTTNNVLTPSLSAAFSATAANFTITAPATVIPGGFISPPGTTSLASGGNMIYYITPYTGYHIKDVKIDGVSQGAITTYSFSNVTANHTIDATFAINSADISGTISYAGSKSGRIYITLQPTGPTQPSNGILGTSISVPGAFTIRGVADGSYNVNAFMDSLDLGAQVQISPSGTTAATVAGSNLTGLSIALSDPTPAAPAAPVMLTASPGDGSLLMDWDKQRNNGIEPADAYDIYWGTSAGVSKVSNSGSRLNVPAGFDSPVVIDGLNNGDKLYFTVIAKSGGVESSPSTPIGPFTIGAPAGGYSVSGTLNYSGTSATGPLYIAIVNPMTKGAAGIYFTTIAAPSASNNFTVTGVPNGEYVIYSIIDMNNDRLFGTGDVMTPDNQAPAIKVNGTALTGVTVSLTGANGDVAITTDHNIPASGPGEFFNVEGSVRGQLKRPVSVTLTAAPATIGIPLPMDLGLDGKDGSGTFRFWTGSSTRPTLGDTYTFTVTYADGTVDTTATAAVTGVSDNFPTNPQITTPVTTVPTFSWVAPATQPASYSVWVGAVNSTDVWDAWDLPASINSITYGATGSSAQPLLIGSSYYWHVSTKDPKGNRASIGSNFVPANQGTPLIFWPAPADVSLGTALSNAELNATASVPGTFSYSPASGTVLPVGAQTLTVSFTPTDITNFTSTTATVTLNINPVVTATGSSGGSITPAGVTMVTNGGNQPYSIVPTTGYHIVDIKVDGVSQGAISSYTFSSVTANHTIDATFAIDTYALTTSVSTGSGTITVSPLSAGYINGSIVQLTAIPDPQWVFTAWGGDCSGSANPYSLIMDAAKICSASFSAATLKITATAGGGGSITPAGVTTVVYNGSQSYVISANTGHHILDVKIDGVSQGAISSFSFTNTIADHTIDVRFAVNLYTITASAGAGGSIFPSGANTLPFGASQTFVFTPDSGYFVDNVKVDNVSVGMINSYTFTNLNADHTITVDFSRPNGVLDPTNTSGVPKIGDAMIALAILMGDIVPTPTQLAHADVAPLLNGVPQPDGKIDIGDVLLILRKVVGLAY